MKKMEKKLYVGRIVGVFKGPEGRGGVFYRVSSRSFPNRKAVLLREGARIVPLSIEQTEESPYISYLCLRYDENWAVVSNGSHTEPLFERLTGGFPPKEAFALALLAYDFEKDQKSTPRICAAFRRGEDRGYLGIIKRTGLQIEEISVSAGEAWILGTYELIRVGAPETKLPCKAQSATQLAHHLLRGEDFRCFLNPICSVCAVETSRGFEVACAQKS